MAKQRTHIPKRISEEVLKEFNYRCAKCGADRPHLHHIDENPANNDALNIIPLCPNCHLVDQHNPTRFADPNKLKLFRKHKDPAILKPEFDPLFRRLQFFNTEHNNHSLEELENMAIELCEFIWTFEKGEFYAKKVGELIIPRDLITYNTNVPRFRTKSGYLTKTEDYRRELQKKQEKVHTLVVEMLRYQPW